MAKNKNIKRDKILVEYRKEIDKIDKEIVKGLKNRLNLVKKIGVYKKNNGIDIEDRDREKKIINKINRIFKLNSKMKKYIAYIYNIIFKFSKEIQK